MIPLHATQSICLGVWSFRVTDCNVSFPALFVTDISKMTFNYGQAHNAKVTD